MPVSHKAVTGNFRACTDSRLNAIPCSDGSADGGLFPICPEFFVGPWDLTTGAHERLRGAVWHQTC